ncbi:MAG: bifunctional phosphoribosyl-AMP cyclohydrolase/phosphoribosyl-ATP diphosphatase HisIE [Myxococcota bacterium]|nr:bifunctional phosphoribosyl-AMP cyclohydrolase/phosphoribosyl-ATP diphosphatase HisIE [Myxococcota bacterium]
MTSLAETIDWQKVDNLIPAIVQDTHTRQVLMLGYMNREALEQTQASQRVTFFSRTKERLWQKGETSGNFLTLTSIQLDCDQDTLLVEAVPAGPTCHLGTTSCFGTDHAPGIGFLGHLETTIRERHQEMPEGSYTTRLFKEGIDRISQKVGEEAVETVIAAKNTERDPLINEVSDLVYHLLVLLREKSVDLNDVVEQLRTRHSS